jgi:Fe2+ or Zn2+ uptake regulation protein
MDLREPPHAHSVCRACGRIAEVQLSGLDSQQLTSLAADGPPEWAIDGISLSLTGFCPRCRKGLGTP